MPDKADSIAVEWFKRADDDAVSIRAILKEGGAASTACFLSQQVAEKCLKGLLVSHGKTFPKVHDLIELETLLHEILPDVGTLHNDLVVMNRYYIEARYPGAYQEFDLVEAQAAFDSALRVQAFVLKKAKQ